MHIVHFCERRVDDNMEKSFLRLFGIALLFFTSVQALPLSQTPTPSIGLATYREVVEINPKCLSPCWWGFELGETNVEEVVMFLEDKFERDIHFSENEDGLQFWDISLREELLPFASSAYLTVLSQHDLFTGIRIGYTRYDDEYPLSDEYALEKVISNYGTPDEIWFHQSRNTSLMLFYNDLPMVVSYAFRLSYPPSKFNENSTLICPRNDDLFIFYIFTLLDFRPHKALYEGMVDLEVLAGIAPEAFAENIQKQPDWCFEVPNKIK